MAVYYKFKSAKDYLSVPIDGCFISVANLKEKIFESKNLGSGTDFDLLVYNAQTNEEYDDEAMLIPRNASVIVRRLPGWPRLPVVIKTDESRALESKVEKKTTSSIIDDPDTKEFAKESECYDFGTDLFSEVVPVQSGNPVGDALSNRADEDKKIQALVDTPTLGCQWQKQEASGFGRGLKRAVDITIGRIGGFVSNIPPQGYVCHRCKIAGHFIQHCPTNGDPDFDIKRLKTPKGLPKSMLMETPDRSYALPSGAVAALKPNEAAFEKEIEGIPSARPVINIPPELYCPLCKKVMEDAVLSSRCCFNSFCDKCIREHIISKSFCACGARDVLADYLLPNNTLRETINRILERKSSNSEKAGSLVHIRDKVPTCSSQSKEPSSTLSVEEKCATPFCKADNPIIHETVKERKYSFNIPEHSIKESRATKDVTQSEVTLELVSVKEATLHVSAPQADQGKKKRRKTHLPSDGDLQWKTSDCFTENNGMPLGPSAYNTLLGRTELGFGGYIMPCGVPTPSHMSYTPGYTHVGFYNQDPYLSSLFPQRSPDAYYTLPLSGFL